MDLIDPHTFNMMDQDSEGRIIPATSAREIRNLRINEYSKQGVRVGIRGTRRIHNETFDFDTLGDNIIGVNPEDPITSLALELTFDSIINAPVSDVSNVSDWNTFFDLPTNGTPFESVQVAGNLVKLFGGAGITTKYGLFDTDSAGIGLISIVDESNSITNLGGDTFGNNDGDGCPILEIAKLNGVINTGGVAIASDFYACNSLKIVELKNATNISDATFFIPLGASSMESIDLRSCLSLGGSVLDDSVFFGITGRIITLIIPSGLMACNGGSPDEDIQYLQTNNTVTIVTV